jgi:hypothetical protein
VVGKDLEEVDIQEPVMAGLPDDPASIRVVEDPERGWLCLESALHH